MKRAKLKKTVAKPVPVAADLRVQLKLRQVAGHFAPEVGRTLRILAAEKDTSVQALLGEALSDLFKKYGKPPIAD